MITTVAEHIMQYVMLFAGAGALSLAAIVTAAVCAIAR